MFIVNLKDNITFPNKYINEKHTFLFKWNKSGTVCSTNTWSTVFNRLICHRKFSQIVSNHFRFDFNLTNINKLVIDHNIYIEINIGK